MMNKSKIILPAWRTPLSPLEREELSMENFPKISPSFNPDCFGAGRYLANSHHKSLRHHLTPHFRLQKILPCCVARQRDNMRDVIHTTGK